MGHLTSFSGKEKGRTFKNLRGCRTSDCAHLLRRQPRAHVRACVCAQVFSGGGQLFHTGILHIWRPAAASGHGGWPPYSSDQERWRRESLRLRTNGKEHKTDMVKGDRAGFIIAEQ